MGKFIYKIMHYNTLKTSTVCFQSGFAQHCKSEDDEVTVIEYVSILIIGISVLLICYFIIRLFIKLGMF